MEQVSVDTYIGRRDTANYKAVRGDGVEVLVSSALSPHIRNIHMDVKKYFFMTSLRARLELRNGHVVTTA